MKADKSKDHNCFTCNLLRSKLKFGDPRYFCRHRGCIEDPNNKVCDCWEEQDETYSTESTIKDYQ